MRKTGHLREAEAALGAKSQRLAEAQLKLVDPERLAQTITDYIEWRTFAYWVRLAVETEGGISAEMRSILEQRCPGFLQYAEAYRRGHPNEREFLWLRLISWIDDEIFGFAKAEGWPHALGYFAARDPRLDRVRAYWLFCDDRWKQNRPARWADFAEWRRAALPMLHSLLLSALLAIGVANHLIDPRSIHSFPVEFVPMLLEECFQGTILDPIISA